MQETTGTRTYDSPLRRENAQRTRKRILDAALLVISEDGDFVVAQVAKRAGVSVRTVYHHFPDRETMLDAVGEWLAEELGYPKMEWPADLTSFADLTETMAEQISADLDKMNVFFSTPVGQTARRQARARRLEHLRRLAHAELAEAAPQVAEWVAVIIHQLASSRTWLAMTDEAGLDPSEAAKAVGWSIKTLIEGVKGTTSRNTRGEARSQ
jgi:AcrR family transcriptional regulator